ncbi:hypothetical protein [Brytella acorum]|uniref:hypothetical protein n=1 Tax=Brytella acorum TaxID=2959299 RepID=UPI0025AEC8A1|nr:hypothetical protein [Brytella acorum]MDF3626213.1 hypothetical protein [Brytella acorum]
MPDFPTVPLPIDPQATAEQMIRLFGDEAENMAQKRASMFLAQEDMDQARQWLIVTATVRELTHGTRRAGQAVH